MNDKLKVIEECQDAMLGARVRGDQTFLFCGVEFDASGILASAVDYEAAPARSKDELEAIENGMARSLMTVIMNVTDMPGTDLLLAIQKGVEKGIYDAALGGAFSATDDDAKREEKADG